MNLQTLVATKLKKDHGLTIEQVLDQQGPMIDNFEGLETREFESSGAEFKFDDKDMKLTIESTEWKEPVNVTFTGYQKIMRMVGFPESVISKYPTYLMIPPLNFGFKQKISDVKAIVKDNNFVAFTKPSIEMVSTRKLLEIMANKVGADAVFERFEHGLGYTHCSILSPKIIKEWDDDRVKAVLDGEHNRRKDVVCGGVTFQNSLLGEHPLTVESYVYRLVCSNGLISADSMFKWTRRTETKNVEEWFSEMVDSALLLSEHEFAKLDQLRGIEVDPEHRKDLMSNIFSQYGMNQHIRLRVLENLQNEPPRNMYDVLQAITNVANAEEYQDNPHMIRRLQEIGGELATRDHICSQCHSVLHT